MNVNINLKNWHKVSFVQKYGNSRKYEDLFDLAAWRLFHQAKAVPGNNELIVSGYVLSDGKGDHMHMLNMAKELHKKFPDRKIRIISVGSKVHVNKLSSINVPNIELHLAYYGEASLCAGVVPSTVFPQNTSMIMQKIKEADVWLSGPITIPGLFNSLQTEAQTKGIAIEEYDARTNFGADNFKKTVSMGLKPTSKGIMIKSLSTSYAWPDLENAKLKNILFNSQNPIDQDIQDYLSSHDTFFCYVSKLETAKTFIFTATGFAKLYSDKANVDIIYPCKGNFESVLKDLDQFDLKSHGIGTVRLVSQKGEEQKEVVKVLNHEGKELRIIDVGVLTPKDFKKITLLSHPLVACTGNTSVCQALAYGKIPFYEYLGNTDMFRRMLITLAKEKFGEDSPLFKFLAHVSNEEYSELIKHNEISQEPLLAYESLVTQAKEFGQFMLDNYAFNPLLQGMVNEELCRKNYPAFAKIEDEIRSRFLEEKISLEDSLKALELEIRKLNLLD